MLIAGLPLYNYIIENGLKDKFERKKSYEFIGV